MMPFVVTVIDSRPIVNAYDVIRRLVLNVHRCNQLLNHLRDITLDSFSLLQTTRYYYKIMLSVNPSGEKSNMQSKE